MLPAIRRGKRRKREREGVRIHITSLILFQKKEGGTTCEAKRKGGGEKKSRQLPRDRKKRARSLLAKKGGK